MHEKHLYEYAVVRVVPKLEREEFINVGLILFCKKQKFLKMEYKFHREKIMNICSQFDLDQAELNVDSFRKIADGQAKYSPISSLDKDERFRWLTAVKSSSIQTSRPHPGLTNDLEKTFETLYKELVL